MAKRQREQAPAAKIKQGRGRARFAKVVITTASIFLFATTAVFARNSYAGHHKEPTQSLKPPQEFVNTVRKNQLEAGRLAPIQAPPQPETTAS
jgi:hypothetical protein